MMGGKYPHEHYERYARVETMSERLQLWFNLSYASWVTLPRVMVEAMPEEWQEKMAALLEEWDEAWPNQPEVGVTVRLTDTKGNLIAMPEWMKNYRHPDQEQLAKLKEAPQ